jgi:hypothetical protein
MRNGMMGRIVMRHATVVMCHVEELKAATSPATFTASFDLTLHTAFPAYLVILKSKKRIKEKNVQ